MMFYQIIEINYSRLLVQTIIVASTLNLKHQQWRNIINSSRCPVLFNENSSKALLSLPKGGEQQVCKAGNFCQTDVMLPLSGILLFGYFKPDRNLQPVNNFFT